MYLDEMLFDNLSFIGQGVLKKCGLNGTPQNIDEMHKFIKQIQEEIDKETFYGVMIGTIFYKFVTSVEVRDRQTTARLFEDLFSKLFGVEATDTSTRNNPPVPHSIQILDSLCKDEDWTISADLSSNKREKADVLIDGYEISLKTLKGKVYNRTGNVIDRSLNSEVNVGSLSFRALFKGILPDDKLTSIRDRKGGLGSGRQLRDNVLNVIVETNRTDDFYKRLSTFMMYAYEEDMYLVLKSHYKIIFYLIPSKSFRDVILKLYKEKESEFERVWYRWENNNLRLNWERMIQYMDEFKLSYHKVDILLTKAVENSKIKEFDKDIKEAIKEAMLKLS